MPIGSTGGWPSSATEAEPARNEQRLAVRRPTLIAVVALEEDTTITAVDTDLDHAEIRIGDEVLPSGDQSAEPCRGYAT